MPIELIGKNSSVDFNIFTWPRVLRLARRYGWEPEGALESGWLGKALKEPKRSSDYTSNSFQRVTDEDAKNIGKALKKALKDIPSKEARGYVPSLDFKPKDPKKTLREAFKEVKKGWLVGLKPVFPKKGQKTWKDAPPLDYFSGKYWRQRLQELISFCEEGCFMIY